MKKNFSYSLFNIDNYIKKQKGYFGPIIFSIFFIIPGVLWLIIRYLNNNKNKKCICTLIKTVTNPNEKLKLFQKIYDKSVICNYETKSGILIFTLFIIGIILSIFTL